MRRKKFKWKRGERGGDTTEVTLKRAKRAQIDKKREKEKEEDNQVAIFYRKVTNYWPLSRSE